MLKEEKNHDPAPEGCGKKKKGIKTSLFWALLETSLSTCGAPAILSLCQASCVETLGLPLLPKEHWLVYFLILSSVSPACFLPFSFFFWHYGFNKTLTVAIFPSGHREDGANSVPDCLLVIPESSLAAFMLLITWQTFIQVGAHHVRVQKALAGAVPKIPVSSWVGVSDALHCRILLGFFSGTCVPLGYISQYDPQDLVGLSPWCPSPAVWTPFPHSALTFGSSHLFLTSGSWKLRTKAVVCWNTNNLWGSWKDWAQEINLRHLAN